MGENTKRRVRYARQLGRCIAARRSELNLTQAQLAERVGVGTETVSRFERGATLPSLPTLDQVAKALKTRSADLLTGSSTEPADQAIRIAAWLEGLGERDRAFVVEQLRRLAEHLLAEKSARKK